MRLGLSSYTYVWSVGVPGYPQPAEPMTAEQLLSIAIDLRAGVLQIADNFPLNRLPPAEREALKQRGREAGLRFEIGTSGLEPVKLQRWLDLAVEFESPFLRVVLDTRDHEPTPDEAVALLRQRIPPFERAGVTLAIENHDRFESRVLLDVIERVGSRRLGVCFDTANSIGCLESADRVLSALGPHIVNVHIKDYALFRPPHNKGFVVEGRPAGQGALDIPRLLNRVRGFGRDPNVIVELWPPPQKTLQESIALERRWAEESIAYLRKLIPD